MRSESFHQPPPPAKWFFWRLDNATVCWKSRIRVSVSTRNRFGVPFWGPIFFISTPPLTRTPTPTYQLPSEFRCPDDILLLYAVLAMTLFCMAALYISPWDIWSVHVTSRDNVGLYIYIWLKSISTFFNRAGGGGGGRFSWKLFGPQKRYHLLICTPGAGIAYVLDFNVYALVLYL